MAGLVLALRPIAATPLAPAYVRPVPTRRHLEWLADEYILRQLAKHGLVGPVALHEGTCFLDLVGARVLPGTAVAKQLLEAMPRYRMRRAYRAVGLNERPLRPPDDRTVRAAGAVRIAAATEAVLAAPPGAHGNSPVERTCRRVAVQLCEDVGIGSAECEFALGIGRSALSRLRHGPRDPRLSAAVRLRLAIEERVR